MGVRERIISVRLIEMIRRNPEYAEKVGIKGEMTNLKNTDNMKTVVQKERE